LPDTAHTLAPYHQHQFETVEQQKETSTLGMWAFLVQEVMFFGGLFGAYTVYRFLYPDAFAEASHHLDIYLGAANTAVLICSSMTMALAVRSAQLGRQGGVVGFMVATIALGGVFLGVKVHEYADKFHHHLVPGYNFHWEGPNAGPAQLFFSLYFAMTGMHALHMIIGIAIMLWLIGRTLRGRFSAAYYTPIELFGLYWHFVDIVWIYLFPLLYLVRVHA
jgi:cytochrome c oxidase subunit III